MTFKERLVLSKVKEELPKASDELLEAVRLLLKAELTVRKVRRDNGAD